MKKTTRTAFTLAEIMIVLTVIGILTAIILPSARNLMPDKNLMKFKKYYNVLATAINELIYSDKYYLDGDLGKKPDGSFVDDPKYFCQTLSDILNAKTTNCANTKITDYLLTCSIPSEGPVVCNERSMDDLMASIDKQCLYVGSLSKPHIVLSDNIVFWEPASYWHFGVIRNAEGYETDVIAGADGRLFTSLNDNKFYRLYKFFCMDIDGIPSGASVNDCVNECPFGFGIRIDGKILIGARAKEWLEKGEQKND